MRIQILDSGYLVSTNEFYMSIFFKFRKFSDLILSFFVTENWKIDFLLYFSRENIR